MDNKKVKVLVVEDHLIAKKIAITILKSLNCDVDTADDGNQALTLSTNNTYHLILVDIGLPDIDGFELVQRMRAFKNIERHLPIIALTAHTDNTYKTRCLESGMNGCFSKPLTTEDARDILKNYIA